jgi:hypothetical protein
VTRSRPPSGKGLWVGGPIPLGYRCIGKKLVVVPEEAETVRIIFTRYLALGSIAALIEDLDGRGIRTKASASGGPCLTHAKKKSPAPAARHIGPSRAGWACWRLASVRLDSGSGDWGSTSTVGTGASQLMTRHGVPGLYPGWALDCLGPCDLAACLLGLLRSRPER